MKQNMNQSSIPDQEDVIVATVTSSVPLITSCNYLFSLHFHQLLQSFQKCRFSDRVLINLFQDLFDKRCLSCSSSRINGCAACVAALAPPNSYFFCFTFHIMGIQTKITKLEFMNKFYQPNSFYN